MAQQYNKDKFSGSTDGKPVIVVATTDPGTTIHTAIAGTGINNYDEIWIWASSIHTITVKLTLELGGTVEDIAFNIGASPSGLVLVCPGILLQNAMILKAFAAVASVIKLHGFINQIRA